MDQKPALYGILEAQCLAHKLSLPLMTAIVTVESAWNPWASRYERQFCYYSSPELHAKKVGITVETERLHQKCSFGLLQIMGGTARSIGYSGSLLALTEPAIGLHWGCQYFKKMALIYLNQNDQIAAYNAGSPRKTAIGKYQNQNYVDRVLDALRAAGPDAGTQPKVSY